MRVLVAIAVVLVACRTAGDAPTRSVAPSRDSPAPVAAASAAPARCSPSLSGGSATEGPAYVVVDRVGVLRIADGGVSIALRRTDGRSWDPAVALSPAGELWLSDWDGITVLALNGEIRKRAIDREGTRPERLTVRSRNDV